MWPSKYFEAQCTIPALLLCTALQTNPRVSLCDHLLSVSALVSLLLSLRLRLRLCLCLYSCLRTWSCTWFCTCSGFVPLSEQSSWQAACTIIFLIVSGREQAADGPLVAISQSRLLARRACYFVAGACDIQKSHHGVTHMIEDRRPQLQLLISRKFMKNGARSHTLGMVLAPLGAMLQTCGVVMSLLCW